MVVGRVRYGEFVVVGHHTRSSFIIIIIIVVEHKIATQQWLVVYNNGVHIKLRSRNNARDIVSTREWIGLGCIPTCGDDLLVGASENLRIEFRG